MSRPSLRKEKAKEFRLSWLVLAFHAAFEDLVEKESYARETSYSSDQCSGRRRVDPNMASQHGM